MEREEIKKSLTRWWENYLTTEEMEFATALIDELYQKGYIIMNVDSLFKIAEIRGRLKMAK